MDPYYDQDPEFVRSQCRMLYGHETWLENPRKEHGKIVIDGNYGHHMVNDRHMPIDYAHVAIFDAKGKADIKYEQGPEDNCLRVKFPDVGAGPYTVYYTSDSVPWIENDEGWSRGIKRDFRNVKYSAAYSLACKAIVSDDGKAPDVLFSDLDITVDTAKPKAGSKVKTQIFYEGKPKANLRVNVVKKGASDTVKFITDADGRFEFPVDSPGTYMIAAKYADTSKAVEDEFDEAVYEITLLVYAQ